MTPAPTFMEKSYGFWAAVALADVALFMLWIMPWGTARLEGLSGGVGLYDAMFSYSPELFYQMAEQYTEAGRRFYIGFSLIADTLFPLAYGLFFYFLLTWLAFQAWPNHPLHRNVFWLPLSTVIADFLENAFLVSLVVRFPTEHYNLVQVASALTTIKWLLVGVLCLVAILLALVALWRRLSASVKP